MSTDPGTLPPWSDSMSDGCSFPGGEPVTLTKAQHACCVKHDEAYYYGGSREDRRKADEELRACWIAAGMPLPVADACIAAVRIGGGPEGRIAGVSWAFGGSVFRYTAAPRRPAPCGERMPAILDDLRELRRLYRESEWRSTIGNVDRDVYPDTYRIERIFDKWLHGVPPSAETTPADYEDTACLSCGARPELTVLKEIARITGLTCDQLLGLQPLPPSAETTAPRPQAGWQDIATAPTDQTRVLLWNGYRRAVGWYASYTDGSGGWHRQNILGEPVGPRDIDPETHWMPLPAAPVVAQERDQIMTDKTRHEYMRQLRKKCIEGQGDPIVRRVAGAMEMAIRRVTENVRGWPTLEEEAYATADLIRHELLKSAGSPPHA